MPVLATQRLTRFQFRNRARGDFLDGAGGRSDLRLRDGGERRSGRNEPAFGIRVRQQYQRDASENRQRSLGCSTRRRVAARAAPSRRRARR